jgi:hypothetical protein
MFGGEGRGGGRWVCQIEAWDGVCLGSTDLLALIDLGEYV